MLEVVALPEVGGSAKCKKNRLLNIFLHVVFIHGCIFSFSTWDNDEGNQARRILRPLSLSNR